MQEKITTCIEAVVVDANRRAEIKSAWKTPIVGFADAGDPLFDQLKQAVRPTHDLPQDLLPGARTVIAFFLPFDSGIPRSNHRGAFSSKAWAVAYIETNRLIATINECINDLLAARGFTGTRLPATHNFDEEELMSDWSHKHVAFIAGLGSFGRHHMLITDQGCCGRLGSVVTTADITPTRRSDRERCLFKHDGSCGKCVQRCPAHALADDPFGRHACYDRLLENDRLHDHLGLVDVCGKCAAIVPCSFGDPVKLALRKKSDRQRNNDGFA
jgi:epoxyqueuosine reductase QueG